MASKSNESTHIRVSAEAKAILDKNEGSHAKQIDKLLGVGKKNPKPRKVFNKPQKALVNPYPHNVFLQR